MPIRVQIERVGMYEQYPDTVIHDILITRTDDVVIGDRRYEVANRTTGLKKDVWYTEGQGVEVLVQQALVGQ